MNLSIGTFNNSKTFKHLKAKYIVAACGIAFAATAFVVGATSRTSTQSTRVTTRSVVGYSQPQTSPQVLFVIVDSEAEATRMDGLLSTDSHNWANPMTAQVVVLDTAERGIRFAETVNELMLTSQPDASSFQISDLRHRAEPVARNSEPNNAALNASILSGVISTERATWAFDDAAPSMPASASTSTAAVDAAIMSGVISSERATWAFDDEIQADSR